MGRPRKIEVPGSSTGADTTSETSAFNGETGLPEMSAGSTPSLAHEGGNDSGSVPGSSTGADTTSAIAARNDALSNLPARALAIVTKFEAYGFADDAGHPLTDNLDFIDLVKQATTQPTATQPGITEDGQRTPHKAPVLTEQGWHVPG